MNKTSWADRVEAEQEGLPPPSERLDGDIKTQCDYKEIEGKKYKVTRIYKLERRQVSKTVAQRRNLAKYGDSKNDPPGPNSATTVVAEEIFMQLVNLKGGVEDEQKEEDLMQQAKQKLKTVQCRICKEEHWSAYCPYKDRMGVPTQDDGIRAAAAAANAASKGLDSDNKGGKYIAPNLRGGDARRGEGMSMNPRSKEDFTVRVTNLSEDIRDPDLEELFKPFGQIARIYLAKDKTKNQSKGYAFISYYRKEHAQSAIDNLNGFGYANLILNVEMANRAKE